MATLLSILLTSIPPSGHSQGNGLAFVSLSIGMCPDLGKKISLFAALAPAVYAGPLTTGFPFTALNKMEWKTWKRFFGVLDFIPIMRWSYDYVPARMFVSLERVFRCELSLAERCSHSLCQSAVG